MSSELAEELKNIINSSTADIYIYVGGIDHNLQVLRDLIRTHPNKTEEADLFLITLGGDPDWAYRLVSTIRMHYKKLNVIVPSVCKSAGTLIALGADTLRFHEYGELGPLDVQMIRKDDLFRRNSGLDVFQAISIINSSAYGCFHNVFSDFLLKGGGSISTETAAKIAKDLATGIYSAVASKIDPLELGEKKRAMEIAEVYGKQLQLLSNSSNSKPDSLRKLISDYPSHSYVIDTVQAKELFYHVDNMTNNDYKLYDLLQLNKATTSGQLIIYDLTLEYYKLESAERSPEDDTKTTEKQSSNTPISCSTQTFKTKPRTKSKSLPKS